MNRDQEKLFGEIRQIGDDISRLTGWIQNDFGSMIEEGFMTRADIATSIPAMKAQFDSAFERLTVAEAAMTLILRNAAGLGPVSPAASSAQSTPAIAKAAASTAPAPAPRTPAVDKPVRRFVGRR